MTLKQLLTIMFLATALCWAAWLTVLWQIDPAVAGWFGFGLFYLSLFFALLGTIFLFTFVWRKLFRRFALEYKLVGTSFRQAFFLSLLLVGCLFLQHLGFLTWWNIVILILAVTIIEFLFLSSRQTV